MKKSKIFAIIISFVLALCIMPIASPANEVNAATKILRVSKTKANKFYGRI